jgi:hypothetical protein
VCVLVIESILIWSDAIKALMALNLVLMPSTFTVAMFRVLGGRWGVGSPPGTATALGGVLYINGGKLGRTSEIDALTTVADSGFHTKYLTRREFNEFVDFGALQREKIVQDFCYENEGLFGIDFEFRGFVDEDFGIGKFDGGVNNIRGGYWGLFGDGRVFDFGALA